MGIDSVFKKFSFGENLDFMALKNQINQSIYNKSNTDIVIEDVSRNELLNIYALQKLIEESQDTLRILTTDLDSLTYGTPVLRYALERWLNGKQSRKAIFLLKEKIELKDKKFARIFQFLKYSNQISIKYTLLDDIRNCHYNCLISDESRFKIKSSEKAPHKVVFNFNDPKSTKKLVTDFDFMNDDEITRDIKIPTFNFIKRNIDSAKAYLCKRLVSLKMKSVVNCGSGLPLSDVGNIPIKTEDFPYQGYFNTSALIINGTERKSVLRPPYI